LSDIGSVDPLLFQPRYCSYSAVNGIYLDDISINSSTSSGDFFDRLFIGNWLYVWRRCLVASTRGCVAALENDSAAALSATSFN
jgi:hypothetical protein